jgi:hypothetical protein
MVTEIATEKVSGRVGRTVPRSEAGDRQRRQAPLKHGIYSKKGKKALQDAKTSPGASLTTIRGICNHLERIGDIGLWVLSELTMTDDGPNRIPRDVDVMAAIAAHARVVQDCISSAADLAAGQVKPRNQEAFDPAQVQEWIRKNSQATILAIANAKQGASWMKNVGVYQKDGSVQPLIRRFAGLLNRARLSLIRHAEWLPPDATAHAEELERIRKIIGLTEDDEDDS